jgi:enoyl-CoA hydratase
MTSPHIITERRGHVLLVTINRPEVRNAFSPETTRQMGAAMDQLEAEDDLFLGIITGANGVFSAGADLKAVAAGEKHGDRPRGNFGLCAKPPAKPLIAAVEGFALGGGFEIVLACDLIVAARDTRFGLPEVKRNLVALAGGVLRLPSRLPYHLAMEMALDGDPRSAKFLHAHGMINELTEPGQALAGALELAEKILRNGPTAVAATAQIIRQNREWPTDVAWEKQREIAARALSSQDREEGIRAFLEKRPPKWTGK